MSPIKRPETGRNMSSARPVTGDLGYCEGVADGATEGIPVGALDGKAVG